MTVDFEPQSDIILYSWFSAKPTKPECTVTDDGGGEDFARCEPNDIGNNVLLVSQAAPIKILIMSQGEDDVQRRRNYNVKFCEGWLQHKVRHHGGSNWRKLWLVLKGNIIYIFTSTDTGAENQIGNLTVDTESKFQPRGGDKEKGFKFDLTTGKRLNTFKTEKNSERELWRAYVLGLAKGHVPTDIDLLDSEIRKIQREIDSYLSGNPLPNDPSLIYRQSKSSSEESGVVVSIGPQDGFSAGRAPSYSGSGSSGSRSVSTFVENGGPTVVHKFYDDRSRDQTPPSWFFSHCSRQQAETILQRGEHYGNTLIRESTSYKDNGSYVISKLVWKHGIMTFEHYEVMRTAGGYKVNVENPHSAMRSLSQVIDYFVLTSGGREHTRPMETNDLSLLGLHNPDYDRAIRLDDRMGEPWVWPPAGHRLDMLISNTIEFVSSDYYNSTLEHDYEEPLSPSPPQSPKKSPVHHSKSLGQADSRSIVGILKTQTPLPGNSSKTVGFNPNVPHTVAASRYARQKDIPTMDELVNRHAEAAELQNLDNIIDGFERDHFYVNEEELNKLHKTEQPRQRRRIEDNTPPPPPLPQPHKLLQKKSSYANIQGTDQLESTTEIESLPVAPPAPRLPITAPVTTPLTSPQSTPTPVQPTPHGTKLHTSHSFTPNSSNRPVASVQPTTPNSQNQFRKSLSEEQFKGPIQQIGSPSNFPSWRDNKQTGSPTNFPSWRDNLKPVKQTQQTADNTQDATGDGDTKSGVEVGNPGGVNTLRSKFERVSVGDSAAVLKHASSFDEDYINVEALMRGGSKVRPRRALSSILPMTTQEDTYEILPEDSITSPRKWSISSDTKSQAKFFLPSCQSNAGTQGPPSASNSTVDNEDGYYDVSAVDDIYDDTENIDDAIIYKAEARKVQFQTDDFKPDQTSRLDTRRKTEPAVSVSKKEFEGLNPDFKNKLAGLIGGASPGPTGTGPKSPVGSRPTSEAAQEDHIYAELPPIEPDEVFYVNTKYNKDT